MNVKPGDLAVIVGSNPMGKFLVGRFVEVISQSDVTLSEGFAWNVRIQRPIVNPVNGVVGAVGIAADIFLRPIRPDGITESEVSQLYSPCEIAKTAEAAESKVHLAPRVTEAICGSTGRGA